MAAIALFRGPMHVLIWSNEEVLAFAGRDGRGVPVREAFPEERYSETQAAMDEVYVTGRTIMLNRPRGSLVVAPRVDARDRIVGVATYFEAAPVPQLLRPRGLQRRPDRESDRPAVGRLGR